MRCRLSRASSMTRSAPFLIRCSRRESACHRGAEAVRRAVGHTRSTKHKKNKLKNTYTFIYACPSGTQGPPSLCADCHFASLTGFDETWTTEGRADPKARQLPKEVYRTSTSKTTVPQYVTPDLQKFPAFWKCPRQNCDVHTHNAGMGAWCPRVRRATTSYATPMPARLLYRGVTRRAYGRVSELLTSTLDHANTSTARETGGGEIDTYSEHHNKKLNTTPKDEHMFFC